ncbi:hypothetical protein EHQ16_13830 [Leptospira kanakyensis]|uniref:Uncharacterized protein n=1 Tax=Leptospira kanakyensis TaxID=2484968 RepID=A0A6N4Q0I4_9LEPT|nr:hypothetical protein [Leptospira kanakyensis]TGK51645.1 hypothetical protein EHQ11_08625 [Leptospira kanakyensis]TGK58654.1 hypothetical protein EHQ16_13830 [Leptospira kanakyensis]TGK70857.1 hypothetical protein EHQ18_08700 [Leptospira kanakyensis]
MRNIFIVYLVFLSYNCNSHISLQSPKKLDNSFQLTNSADLISKYDKARTLSFDEFKNGFTNNPKGFNIIFLNSYFEENGRFKYNDGCFSISFPKKEKPELYYVYEQTFLARGVTETIRCNEFSDELKDCLLSFKITSDSKDTEKGQVIFRVKLDTLYHIEPFGFPWDAKPQFGFLSDGGSKKESWRNFKKAIALYRKTPGLGDLQKLGYKPEDIEFFDKTEEWEGY